jgi:DNA-binding SARP family transcriptional activator
MIRLQLHGAPSACATDGPMRRLERKDAGLLAYLAIQGKASRARLAALLWPEADAALARTNLRQRLMRLRRQFPDLVVDDGADLALSPAALGDGAADPSSPMRPLLEDCEYPDCPEFAAWLDARREATQRAAGARLAGTIRSALDAGDLDAALAAATTFAELESESEEAWRLLMEVYFLRGDVASRSTPSTAAARCCGRSSAPDLRRPPNNWGARSRRRCAPSIHRSSRGCRWR